MRIYILTSVDISFAYMRTRHTEAYPTSNSGGIQDPNKGSAHGTNVDRILSLDKLVESACSRLISHKR